MENRTNSTFYSRQHTYHHLKLCLLSAAPMPPTLFFPQISEKQCREALSTDRLAPPVGPHQTWLQSQTHPLTPGCGMDDGSPTLCVWVCVFIMCGSSLSGHRTITITATLEKAQRPANDVMECFVCLYDWNSTYIHTMGRMCLENVDQC